MDGRPAGPPCTAARPLRPCRDRRRGRTSGSAGVSVHGRVRSGADRLRTLLRTPGTRERRAIRRHRTFGYGAQDLQSAYKLPSGRQGWGRRWRSWTRSTIRPLSPISRAVPVVLRSASVHDCERLLPQGEPDRRNASSGGVPTGRSRSRSTSTLVSAVCPNCHILLVEASTNLDGDLYTAEDTAAGLGANAISNSWGGSELLGQTADDVHFDHPGVAITAELG